jgi:hypothetical protein
MATLLVPTAEVILDRRINTNVPGYALCPLAGSMSEATGS